jgi:hypothetical protein
VERRRAFRILVTVLLGIGGLLIVGSLVEFRTLMGFVVAVLVPGALAARYVLGRSAPLLLSLMLTLLLGLSLLVLAGLLLSASPFGLTGGPLLILLVVLCSLVALATIRSNPRLPVIKWPHAIKPSPSVALILLAVFLVGVAIVGARIAATPHLDAPLWQLWMRRADDSGQHVEIGLRNAAGPAAAGTVVLSTNGAPFERWDDIHLEPGTEWRVTVEVGTIPAGTHQLELTFANDEGSDARHATLSLPDRR